MSEARNTRKSSSRPLLWNTLAVILPTPAQTEFLKACLCPGDSGRKAWETWRQWVGDPKAALRGESASKQLLPLLFTALRHNAAAVDQKILPYLRAAYVREDLRSAIYNQVCSNVVSTLTAGGIPLIVLKGAALAGEVYGDRALRHSRNVDLLLHEENLLPASRLLPPQEFVVSADDHQQGLTEVRATHHSGLPVELHSRLFELRFYRAPLAEIWARSRTAMVADVPTRVLSPPDNLLHVCGQASCCRSRESLQWVCDAWYLLQRHPDLDWDVLLEGTVRTQLALPLSVLLGYLAREFNAPIPATLLDRLAAVATHTSIAVRETALVGARAGTRATFSNLLRQSGGWRARLLVLKWIFFPAPSCLRQAEEVRHPLLLPAYYAYRPFRYLVRRARFWLGGRSRLTPSRAGYVPLRWRSHTRRARES